MKMMKKDGRQRRIAGAPLMACLCALTLLASCTQDEPAEQGDTLPEGTYPLQIGSISVSAEESGQPQSRVGENSAGTGSEFKEGDVIGVSLDGNIANYTYDGSTWTSSTNPLYWKDTNKGTVTAWYPVVPEIDFTQQDKGLTYLLKATTDNASYNTAAILTFTHQLAKVRVVLTGSKASEVADVKIYSYPKARNTQGTLSKTGTPAYYPMRKATYGSTTCWEANMAPGTLAADKSFQISKSDGTTVNVTLADNNGVPIEAGKMHTITITVEPSVEELKATFYNAFFNNGDTSSPKGKLSGQYYQLYATGTTIQKLINDILKTSINVGEYKTITTPWEDSIYLEYLDTLFMRIIVGSIKFYVYIDNMQGSYPELTL